MEPVSTMLSYWGKARNSDAAGPPYHLLAYHSLDVAAVAAEWWEQSRVLRSQCCYATGLEEAQTYAWVVFFIALHDYGKWDIRFQLKAPHALQPLYPAFTPDMAEPDSKYFHGPQGYAWFMWEDSSRLGLSDESLYCWQPWLAAVTGHHGSLPDNPEAAVPLADEAIIERDRTARLEWLHAIEALFLHPVGLHLEELPPPCPDLLAGFCAVCDWLGSNDQRFFYETKVYALADYWRLARERARTALGESGLHGNIVGAGGMRQLFPKKPPRQLQTLVDTLPLQSGLTIVEAPTGSGKTELALAYASKLLAAGVAESIVFALPTQATANAMLQRLEEVANRLFTGGANVVLAHGKDRYNPNFQALRQAALRPTVQTAPEERDASVQCVQWLGASRKRAFLGQIGVCTVDQVLLSVLPVRHQFVRAFGLRKSVLIIDEVHAYDIYMYGLLTRVLQGQQRAGGSAVLLSATLPRVLKSALVEAWGEQLEESETAEKIPYPLMTWVSSAGQLQTLRLPQEDMPAPRTVLIEPYITDDLLPDQALCERMIEAARRGALVGVVCNLVANAQDLARKLRGMTSLPVDLFHARYLFADRQQHEAHVMQHYGENAARHQGRILVATQVIEQSLDLDFDWLISQLCPIDLLFQRLGRLHRHPRDWRPEGFAEPHCTVLLPQDTTYGLHAVVYSCERVLWRTQQLLAPCAAIEFPAAYRAWIERVYQLEPWADEPTTITEKFNRFSTDEFGRYFVARQLSKSEATPWPDTEGAAARLTRDGDMNLSLLLVQTTPTGRQPC